MVREEEWQRVDGIIASCWRILQVPNRIVTEAAGAASTELKSWRWEPKKELAWRLRGIVQGSLSNQRCQVAALFEARQPLHRKNENRREGGKQLSQCREFHLRVEALAYLKGPRKMVPHCPYQKRALGRRHNPARHGMNPRCPPMPGIDQRVYLRNDCC